MMLDYYEETLKELEDVVMNLDDLSNRELRHELRSIVNRGWLQIETMFGARQNKKYDKEEIQKHFNEMLKLVPMSKTEVHNES